MCDKGLISGAVSLVQHFDESLSLNIRFHKLFGDQLHSLSAFDEKLKSINTQVKRTATNRIANIIIEGQDQAEFHRAKIIHITLSGFILSSISENNEFDYQQLLIEFTDLTLNALK